MYCKYCGNTLTEDAKFCPTCGKNVSDTTDDLVDETLIEVGAPAEDEQKNSLSNKILSTATVSLALSMVSVMFISLIPIVLSITEEFAYMTVWSFIALVINIVALCIKGSSKRNLSKFSALYDDLTVKARVGKILCIPSTILNIVLLVCDAIFLLVSLSANQ